MASNSYRKSIPIPAGPGRPRILFPVGPGPSIIIIDNDSQDDGTISIDQPSGPININYTAFNTANPLSEYTVQLISLIPDSNENVLVSNVNQNTNNIVNVVLTNYFN